MKNHFIFITIFLGTLYSQCDSYTSSECDTNSNCEWVEEIESVTCSSLVLDQELCEAAPECTYVCDDGGGYFGWCNSYCYGEMTYIDNGYCIEVEVLECSEMDEPNCNIDDSCEWIEDISYASCSSLGTGNSSFCDAQPNCSYSWLTYSCGGGTYQIDNSYCEEIEMLECNEEYEFQCTDGSCIPIDRLCNNINDCEDGSDEIDCESCSDFSTESNCNYLEECEWVDNTETGSCSTLPLSVCDLPEYGTCYSDCTNWGSYYNGMFCYGTMYCAGGSYQLDNNYCQEVQYLLGDITGDFYVNILDIIQIVNLILDNEYTMTVDMNNDNQLNVLDVILVVDIILGN